MAISISGNGDITGINSLNTDVSATELGYLDGVTGGIQGQINNGGLVHLDTQSISSGSDLYFNNIFSSIYDNYKIVAHLSGSSSSSNGIWCRLRTSEVDATTGYSSLAFFPNATTFRELRTDALQMGVVGSGSRQAMVAEIYGPYLEKETNVTGTNNGTSADFRNCFFGGQHATASQYESMHIFSQAPQTWNGTVSVYGYRKS